ncbi:MAG: hypothetical protein M1823_000125 [Watsoniomyces obsoletus]|nr:MAG: hypothetical protein M1823_000125 [Watsoniomyces obsoletus]
MSTSSKAGERTSRHSSTLAGSRSSRPGWSSSSTFNGSLSAAPARARDVQNHDQRILSYGRPSEDMETSSTSWIRDRYRKLEATPSRTSGGFLLDSANTTPDRQSSASRFAGSGDGADEEWAEHHPVDGVPVTPTRRRLLGDQPDVGNGSPSPAVRPHGPEGNNLPPSREGQRWSEQEQESNQSRGEGRQAGRDHYVQGSSSSTSSDLGPARIVNLALNLNEARRRSGNFSGLAAGHARDQRRRVSALSSGSGRRSLATNDTLSPSAASHDRQRHRAQRTASTYQEGPPHPPHARKRTSDVDAVEGSAGSPAPPLLPFDDQQDFEYHFSKATLARAAIARAELELAAEYRRLLQKLQPLRDPAGNLSDTSSIASRSPLPSRRAPTSGRLAAPSRPYNPLQSIRNRKVRRRERQTLEPSPEKWTDLEAVRAWVDEVEKHSPGRGSESSESGPLPPYPILRSGISSLEATSPSLPLQQGHILSSGGEHPRVDWVIRPQELLADAYWLEQDGHKHLVEGNDGAKLLPDTAHHSSRTEEREITRLGTPGAEQPQTADDTPLSGTGHKRTLTSQSAPGSSDIRDVHRRRRRDFHKSLDARIRGAGDRLRFDRNQPSHPKAGRSSSESDHSRGGGTRVDGNNRNEAKDSLERMDSARLDKQMQAMLRKEAQQKGLAQPMGVKTMPANFAHSIDARKGDPISSKESSRQATSTKSKRRSLDVHTPIRKLLDGSISSKADLVFADRQSTNPSAEGLDPHAPESAMASDVRLSTDSARGFIPSLAMSVSPSTSRRVSPTRNRVAQMTKKTTSVLSGGSSLEKNDIEANDFAAGNDSRELVHVSTGLSSRSQMSSGQAQAARVEVDPASARRGSQTGSLPELQKEQDYELDRTKSGQSRFRGMLKSVRADGMLRKEAHKIGNRIWRREEPAVGSPDSSPSSSPRSNSNSSASGVDSPPRRNVQAETLPHPAPLDPDGALSRITTSSEFSKYESGILPKFVSTAVGNGSLRASRSGLLDEPSGTTRSAPDSLRARRPLLSRHASNHSTSTPQGLSQVNNKDTNVSPSASRRSSFGIPDFPRPPNSLASKAVQAAGSRLNAILGIPGRVDTRSPSVTGLSRLEPSTSRSLEPERRTGSHRHSGVSDIQIQALHRRPTRQEIARVRTSLLSSGVKAQEILRRVQQVEKIPRSLLGDPFVSEPPLVPRNKQHTVAAQLLNNHIESVAASMQTSFRHFSDTKLRDLMHRIAALQESLSTGLGPEVRAYADDADIFSTDIMSTHTLAIKQVNDSIERAMRRRRRRLRWLRRGGYVLLEWILLGLMWWVWLMFTLIRLVRGSIRGVVAGIRWILLL